MAYEQRELTGSLFKNKRKNADNQPDINGRCLIDGKQYFMSGWHKVKQDGEGWYSIAFKPVDESAQAPANVMDDAF